MGAYCRSIVSCLAVFLAMALWAASGQATQEKTPATEETQPIRSFDIEGGSIKLGGGVLASTGFKARLMSLAGKGSIKTELLVLVTNRTPNTVWVEVECQLPEMRQSFKKFKKVKKGKSEGFKWGLKAEEIIWDAEYPFTVSVFADKKQKKALGSETSSFLFNDQSRTELDVARAVLVKEAKVGGRGRLLISGWPEEVVEPPFEWDENYASPGTSLVLKEKTRMRLGKGTWVDYEVRSTGFSNQEALSLWRRIGTEYEEYTVTLNEKGLVQVGGRPGEDPPDSFGIIGFHLGEAFDLALVSKTTNKRAQAKVIPFPIQAQGNGGCSGSVELASKTGHLFLISFQGFQPGEEVEVRSRYKKENIGSKLTASEGGEIRLPLLFGKRDRGKATATATGKNCTVSLEYKVGRDALVVQ